MEYTTIEVKVRLPYAKKTKQLLNEVTSCRIKLAHPTLKNYYAAIVPATNCETKIKQYSNIGILSVLRDTDTSSFTTLLDMAEELEMEVLVVNSAP